MAIESKEKRSKRRHRMEIHDAAYDAYTAWAASITYSLGNFVKPTTYNCCIYECTTAGRFWWTPKAIGGITLYTSESPSGY